MSFGTSVDAELDLVHCCLLWSSEGECESVATAIVFWSPGAVSILLGIESWDIPTQFGSISRRVGLGEDVISVFSSRGVV